MPKSYMTESEKIGLSQNAIYAAESAAADRAGDEEAAWDWLRLAEIPAWSLMSAKRRNGAEWVRQMGLNTESAEKAYGKDWLDKDI
ncbi:hypothetical protein [Magnetospira thiophila]